MQDDLNLPTFTGIDFGYWRVSTAEQNPAYQIDALKEFGIPERRIYGDVVSGASMKRPMLKDLMKAARRGDRIVVWKIDRLGRSLKDVLLAIEDLRDKGIHIHSLTQSIDTTNAMGRMVMHILLVVAEMERELISERTRAGMARKRRDDPKWKPGKPHYIRDYPKRIEKFRELWAEGMLERPDMTGKRIVEIFNEADPKAPRIGSPQVYFNWKRAGYPGFEAPGGDDDADE